MLPLFEDEVARERIRDGLALAAAARRASAGPFAPDPRPIRTAVGSAFVVMGERLLAGSSLEDRSARPRV